MMQGPRAEGLLVRKQADIEASTEQIRLAVTGGRTDLPFVDVQSYASLNGPRLSHWLIGTQLLLIFGALALATAALGLYAAFAHSVAERRQEIAVRLAVGASRQRVLLMMLFEGTAVAGRGAIERRRRCDARRMGGAVHHLRSVESRPSRDRRRDVDCADRRGRCDLAARTDRLAGGTV